MGIRTAKVSPVFSFLTAPCRTLKPNAPESEEYGISNNLWNTTVKFLTAAMNRGDLLRLSTAFDKVGTASIYQLECQHPVSSADGVVQRVASVLVLLQDYLTQLLVTAVPE